MNSGRRDAHVPAWGRRPYLSEFAQIFGQPAAHVVLVLLFACSRPSAPEEIAWCGGAGVWRDAPRTARHAHESLGLERSGGCGGVAGFRCVTRMHNNEATRAQTTPEVVKASIEHLTSYEGMGRAMIRCVDGCACEPQTIDAHRVDAHRNVSVYLQHTFTIAGGSPTCGVQLQVLNESSSGGFKFKVRTITLTTI